MGPAKTPASADCSKLGAFATCTSGESNCVRIGRPWPHVWTPSSVKWGNPEDREGGGVRKGHLSRVLAQVLQPRVCSVVCSALWWPPQQACRPLPLSSDELLSLVFTRNEGRGGGEVKSGTEMDSRRGLRVRRSARLRPACRDREAGGVSSGRGFLGGRGFGGRVPRRIVQPCAAPGRSRSWAWLEAWLLGPSGGGRGPREHLGRGRGWQGASRLWAWAWLAGSLGHGPGPAAK